MTHKDYITGCTVADLHEIVKGEELMEMYNDLDKDIKMREQELMTNPLPFILEAIEWINEGCDDEDKFPNAISATALEVHSSFGFGGTEKYVIADVTWEGGETQRIKFMYGDNGGGSFYEPPCAEYDFDDKPVLKEDVKDDVPTFQDLLKELLDG